MNTTATPKPPEKPSLSSPSTPGSASSKSGRYAVTPMNGMEIYRIGSEAIITLQPSTGYVAVSCPHHNELNGCYWWNARGKDSLHKFLLEIDQHYTLGKLFAHGSLEEYDEDRTKKEIRQYVLTSRRDGELTNNQARDLWDEIDIADSDHDIATISGIECPYDFIRTKPKYCAGWFWDNVWKSFTDHLRDSLQNAQGEPRR